jgi:ribosomal protein S18 acetylase RimI-like enzyme
MAAEGISLRPRVDADDNFLCALYASTREEELKRTDWSDEQKRQFCRMQFDAQCNHYAQYYPGASFDVIEREGRAIGRLYVYRGDEKDVRIVDITLAPEARGSGVGTKLLLEVMREAEDLGKSVSIHVEQFNPALTLYKRLGFEHIDDHGVYYLMRWAAPSLSG